MTRADETGKPHIRLHVWISPLGAMVWSYEIHYPGSAHVTISSMRTSAEQAIRAAGRWIQKVKMPWRGVHD